MALEISSFEAFAPGTSFTTPSLHIDESDAAELIRIGGYVHPLFTDPTYAADSVFGRSPLPGEAVLHAMGGLAERSGRFDESVVALLGFDAVRFHAPAFPGDTLHMSVEVIRREARPNGKRGEVVMAWRCRNERGELLCDATARMLFRLPHA
ncbi:MAG TPA: MaoC/PaaZ C-terminal domain-containing protein [Actinomycetota bacterium]|nr:MaoC/PaaZ C-terminal domain-containing protein [Actinomycetota bacterium]